MATGNESDSASGSQRVPANVADTVPQAGPAEASPSASEEADGAAHHVPNNERAGASRSEPGAATSVRVDRSTLGALAVGPGAQAQASVQIQQVVAQQVVIGGEAGEAAQHRGGYSPKQFLMLRVSASSAGGVAMGLVTYLLPGSRDSDLELATVYFLGLIAFGAVLGMIELSIRLVRESRGSLIIQKYDFYQEFSYFATLGSIQATLQFQLRWRLSSATTAAIICAAVVSLIVKWIRHARRLT